MTLHRSHLPKLLLALAFSAGLLACDESKRSPSESDDTCAPACDGKCGVPDGCGGQCGCPLGTLCSSAGACEPDPCAACDEGERCENGACVCAPKCEDNPCGADGCGGTCPCPEGYVQNAQGEWVRESECHDTCVSSGWICGELCGQDCGECRAGSACERGWCTCAPRCDGTRCDDGCGGACACTGDHVCDAAGFCVPPASCTETCRTAKAECGEVCGTWCGDCPEGQSCSDGLCRAAISCTDCPLQLRILERSVSAGLITSLRVAVEFQPGGAPLPRLIDLRLKPSRPMGLMAVELGEALVAAEKRLAYDEASGKPWIEREDGSVQVLVVSSAKVSDIAAGRLLELRFSLSEPGPIELALVKREQTFAPPESDAALQASAFDAPLVITR